MNKRSRFWVRAPGGLNFFVDLDKVFLFSPYSSRLFPKAYSIHRFDDRAERIDLVARLPSHLPYARDSTTHAHFKQSLASASHLSSPSDPVYIELNRKSPPSRLTGFYLGHPPSQNLIDRQLSCLDATHPVVTLKLAAANTRPPRSTGCDRHRNSHGHCLQCSPTTISVGTA